MAGYNGFSMSNNAVAAYADGERPLSKWTKADVLSAIKKAVKEGEISISFEIEKLEKLPVKALREKCLYCSSWHHTSSYYNKTDFYSLDLDELESLTNEEIVEILSEISTKKVTAPEEVWECTFLEWSGTRNHPKATEYTEVGTVRGGWFYRADGSKKKTTANGFKFIRRIK